MRRHRLYGPPEPGRRLRRNQTRAEALLWSKLHNRQLENFKFRRQYRIGPYIADFACLEVRLIVELDGGQHGWEPKKDEIRTRFLDYAGFRVLRFWNRDFLENVEGTLEEIRLACLDRTPS